MCFGLKKRKILANANGFFYELVDGNSDRLHKMDKKLSAKN